MRGIIMGSTNCFSSRTGYFQIILAAVLGVVPAAALGDDPKGGTPKVLSLSRALDGKSVIFEVKFERPKDADELSSFYYGRGGRMGSFLHSRSGLPELRSNPPWNS